MKQHLTRGRSDQLSNSGGIRRRADAPSLDSEAGLRAAYDALGGELYRMAHRALNDDGLAEEVVQETFLRAWRAADRYDSAEKLSADLDVRYRPQRHDRSGPGTFGAPTADGAGGGAYARGKRHHRGVPSLLGDRGGAAALSPHHRHAIVETYYIATGPARRSPPRPVSRLAPCVAASTTA